MVKELFYFYYNFLLYFLNILLSLIDIFICYLLEYLLSFYNKIFFILMDHENRDLQNQANQDNVSTGNSATEDQMSNQNEQDSSSESQPNQLNGLQAESQYMEYHLESDEFHDASENLSIADVQVPVVPNGNSPSGASQQDSQLNGHDGPIEQPIEAVVQPPRVEPAVVEEVVEPLFVEVLQPPPPEPNPAHGHHHVIRLARAIRMRWRRFADNRFGLRRRHAPPGEMDVDQPAPGEQAIVNEDFADEDNDVEPLVGESSSSDESDEEGAQHAGALNDAARRADLRENEEILQVLRRHRARRNEEGNPAPEDALGVEGRAEPNVGDELLALMEKRERSERATRREKRKRGAGERKTARDFDVTLPGIHSVL